MKKLSLLLMLIAAFSCKENNTVEKEVVLWEPYNDSAEVAANQDHEVERMRYKLIQSEVIDKNEVFRPLYDEVSKMTEADYALLKP